MKYPRKSVDTFFFKSMTRSSVNSAQDAETFPSFFSFSFISDSACKAMAFDSLPFVEMVLYLLQVHQLSVMSASSQYLSSDTSENRLQHFGHPEHLSTGSDALSCLANRRISLRVKCKSKGDASRLLFVLRLLYIYPDVFV